MAHGVVSGESSLRKWDYGCKLGRGRGGTAARTGSRGGRAGEPVQCGRGVLSFFFGSSLLPSIQAKGRAAGASGGAGGGGGGSGGGSGGGVVVEFEFGFDVLFLPFFSLSLSPSLSSLPLRGLLEVGHCRRGTSVSLPPMLLVPSAWVRSVAHAPLSHSLLRLPAAAGQRLGVSDSRPGVPDETGGSMNPTSRRRVGRRVADSRNSASQRVCEA